MNRNLLTILVLLAAIAATEFARADTTWVSGQTGRVWTMAGSPYVVVDSSWVNPSTGLVVEQGVEILLATSSSYLVLQGTCLFEGAIEDSVEIIQQPRLWEPLLLCPYLSPIPKVEMRYVRFTGPGEILLNADTVLLEYSRFQHAGENDPLELYILGGQGLGIIRNCFARRVSCDKPMVNVEDCEIRDDLNTSGSFNIRGLCRNSEFRPRLVVHRIFSSQPLSIRDAFVDYLIIDASYWANIPVSVVNTTVVTYFNMDYSRNFVIDSVNASRAVFDYSWGTVSHSVFSGRMSVLDGSNIWLLNNTFIHSYFSNYEHILHYGHLIEYASDNTLRLTNNIAFSLDPLLTVFSTASPTFNIAPEYNITWGMDNPWQNCPIGPGNQTINPRIDLNDPHAGLLWDSPAIDVGAPDRNDPDGSRSDIGARFWDHRFDHPPIITTPNLITTMWGDTLRLIVSASDEGTPRISFPDGIPTWMAVERNLDDTEITLFNGRVPYGVGSARFRIVAIDMLGQLDEEEIRLTVNPRSVLTDTVAGVLPREYSPYTAQQDVIVPEGDSLIIEPGVEIRMDSVSSPVSFVVRGYLIAEGTPTDSISFTAHAEHPWEGIFVSGTSSRATLDYCKITRGSRAFSADSSGRCEISHTLFYPYELNMCFWILEVRQTTDSILIRQSSFPLSSGIHLFHSTAFLFDSCRFGATTATRDAFYIDSSNGEIFCSSFHEAANAQVIVAGESEVSIVHCLFNANPSAASIFTNSYYEGTRRLHVLNNTFARTRGSYIVLDAFDRVNGGTVAEIANNIFYGTPDNAIWLRSDMDSSHVVLNNNCFFMNAADIRVDSSDWSTVGQLTTVNLNGDSTDIYGNIFLDPLFADTIDWHLSEASPCIDAGVDVGLPFEGQAPDIGYYEIPEFAIQHFMANTSSENHSIPPSVCIYPNPTNSSFSIILDGWHGATATVSCFNVMGRVAFRRSISLLSASQRRYGFSVDDLVSGTYYLVFSSGKSRIVQPLIIVR